MFIVYQDGKRCSEYKIKGWSVDSFDTKREAEIFAYHWAYPYSYQDCVDLAPCMTLGKEYDYTMAKGFPVMMKIEEIKDGK